MQTMPLFTRSEISALTGVTEDVLGYWIKRGLLVAQEGGAGRGSHRRFDRVQVHIAVLLRELRAYGSNIEMLSGFAAMLQRGAEIAGLAKYNPEFLMKLWWVATDVLAAARKGESSDDVGVSILLDHEADERHAAFFSENVKAPTDLRDLRLCIDLIDPSPSSAWFVERRQDGAWRVHYGFGFEFGLEAESAGSGIYLGVARLLRALPAEEATK